MLLSKVYDTPSGLPADTMKIYNHFTPSELYLRKVIYLPNESIQYLRSTNTPLESPNPFFSRCGYHRAIFLRSTQNL
jgi:hypothetical protein